MYYIDPELQDSGVLIAVTIKTALQKQVTSFLDARFLQKKKINVKIRPLESTFSAVAVMTELGSSKNREYLTFVRILKMSSGFICFDFR